VLELRRALGWPEARRVTTLLAQSIAIAALVWGQPACGTPVPTFGDLPVGALGYADPRTCLIVVAADRPERWRSDASVCTTVVHEWGHDAGQAHSADPNNVMFEAQTRPYWRCADKWRARFGA
jgi:hypothetical protein